MEYDNDYLGVGNNQHPANQPDQNPDEYDFDDVWDCIDYAENEGKFDPLKDMVKELLEIINNLKKQIK